MIDVAVVGAGKIGTKHARVIESLPTATISHVVDIESSRAVELAETVDAAATDLDDALSADAVYVCTPDDAHVDPARRAIEAGLHTFVEKPLATSIDDADELVGLARESTAVHCVGHVLRFDARYHTVASEIDAVGSLCAIESTRLVSRDRPRRTGAVSGPAMRLGVHDFDLIRWLTGRSVDRVRATAEDGALREEGYDIPDVTTVRMQLSGGPWATVTLGFALPTGHPGSIVDLRIVGARGVVEIDASGREVNRWINSEGEYVDTQLWPDIRGTPAAALSRIDRAFVSAIGEGTTTPVPFEAGRDAVAIARAAERAVGSDRAVPVE